MSVAINFMEEFDLGTSVSIREISVYNVNFRNKNLKYKIWKENIAKLIAYNDSAFKFYMESSYHLNRLLKSLPFFWSGDVRFTDVLSSFFPLPFVLIGEDLKIN